MLNLGIFLILLTAALRVGAGLLLPIAIAGLLALLLDPPVRALRRLGLSTAVGAALVVFGTLGVVTTGAALLAGPAVDWVEAAPKTLSQVQVKIRRLIQPLQATVKKVEEATQSAAPGGPPTVQIKTPGLLQRLSVSTTSFLTTALTVVFLTYFLLAMLPVFRSKVAGLIGTRAGTRNVEELLTEIEGQMSRYMVLNTLTSAGVGLATWGLLAAVGSPTQCSGAW